MSKGAADMQSDEVYLKSFQTRTRNAKKAL